MHTVFSSPEPKAVVHMYVSASFLTFLSFSRASGKLKLGTKYSCEECIQWKDQTHPTPSKGWLFKEIMKIEWDVTKIIFQTRWPAISNLLHPVSFLIYSIHSLFKP